MDSLIYQPAPLSDKSLRYSSGRLFQDTIIWLVRYYYHSSLLSGHLWSLQ